MALRGGSVPESFNTDMPESSSDSLELYFCKDSSNIYESVLGPREEQGKKAEIVDPSQRIREL